jgi:hypothetical protein
LSIRLNRWSCHLDDSTLTSNDPASTLAQVTVVLRNIIATTTLGLALLGAAACADQPQNEPTASSSPSKAVTLADKKTTCEAYLKLDSEMEAKAKPLAEKMAGADKDPSAALSALVELKSLVAEYDTKLTPIAAASADPQVKAAIEAELVEVRATKADLDAAGLDPDKLQAAIENHSSSDLTDKVKSLCA